MASPRDKFLKDMRSDSPPQMAGGGYIGDYLNWMRSEDPKASDGLEADIIEIFSSEKGLRVLKMLEKSVLQRALPLGSDDRALREINAARNLILEIRRIVSNG